MNAPSTAPGSRERSRCESCGRARRDRRRGRRAVPRAAFGAAAGKARRDCAGSHRLQRRRRPSTRRRRAPLPRCHEPSPARSARPLRARSADSLAEEVAILSQASAELHAGRPAAALKALEEHRRKFPRGVLAQERTSARIQALCALGRTKEAQSELARLARTSPNSPHVARARKACGSGATRKGSSVRRAGAGLVLASLSSACEPELVVGTWTCPPPDADQAPGNRSKVVELPGRPVSKHGFCDYVRAGGFCYPTRSFVHASSRARSRRTQGRRVLRDHLIRRSVGRQTRCFREGALPREALYGAWFYVPSLADNTGNWNLMHFQGGRRSSTASGTSRCGAPTTAAYSSTCSFLAQRPVSECRTRRRACRSDRGFTSSFASCERPTRRARWRSTKTECWSRSSRGSSRTIPIRPVVRR